MHGSELEADDAIRITNLTVSHDRHPAVHHISGRFKRGSLTAVVGPNGAGKSSLLRACVGLHRPVTGRVDMAPDLAMQVAYLPQAPDIDRQFPVTVSDMVAMGAWRRLGWLGRLSSADREQVKRAIHVVGLEGFEHRLIAELSAGQFQRVLFARLMVQDAQLIFLDEPFNAVDDRTTSCLMDLINGWHGEGRTVVAVLHEHALIQQHFPQTLLMARELVAWGATDVVLTSEHLARANRMSEAWDEHASHCATDRGEVL